MSDILDGVNHEKPASPQQKVKAKEPDLLDLLEDILGPKQAKAVSNSEAAATATGTAEVLAMEAPVATPVTGNDLPIDAVVEVAVPVVAVEPAQPESVKIIVEYVIGLGRKDADSQQNFRTFLEFLGKMTGLEVQTTPTCGTEAQ